MTTPRNTVDARRWSTRQRLVMLTFETPQQASMFDLRGGSKCESPLGGFDIKLVDSDALDALMFAARDVIDEWGDEMDIVNPEVMSMWVNRLRRALFDLRQAALT